MPPDAHHLHTFQHPPDPGLARAIYDSAAALPLISPHGHVDPALFADPAYRFGSPVDLFVIPDHYLFRMLFSQGVPLESLGIPRSDGGPVETDHRAIWRTVAEHGYLFRGTPTGLWVRESLRTVFGITDPLNADTADAIFDAVQATLDAPDFTPRQLYARFNLDVLATTDAAETALDAHQAIRESGWAGRVIPTFRPDAVTQIDHPGWRESIQHLGARAGREINGYAAYIQALETRRADFKAMGAVATDHGALTPFTARLDPAEADALFQRARMGQAGPDDAARFTGHMLMEMARMSAEDGLVMQLHVGSYRNHNAPLYAAFGPDKGADIPVRTEFTHNLRPLLNAYGSDPRFRLILFTLDESAYSRELAPLAGHYPALLMGPPWWFHDSPNGMRRYLEAVTETAGIYNTAGFNDDTRAFLSIPARHDLWRRVGADWLSGLVLRGQVTEEEARRMMRALAHGLAKRAYRLNVSELDERDAS